MQQSPCAPVEKNGDKKNRPAMRRTITLPKSRAVEPVKEAEPAEEEEVSPAKLIITKPLLRLSWAARG